MAHYAFLDQNNIVTEVIVGKNEDDEQNIDWEVHYGNFRNQVCKRTSYNTYGGIHPEGKQFRKNFAGIGYLYDFNLDAFIPPKTYNSWVLNEETCIWEAPVSKPDDGKKYDWDEQQLNWIEITGVFE